MIATSPPTDAAQSLAARLMSEGLIGFTAAAKKLGSYRNGRPTHPGTLARWTLAGIALADGRTLRLEAVRLNGRWATSEAAVVRFIEAQQDQPVSAATFRTPAERRRASEAASRELTAAGCG